MSTVSVLRTNPQTVIQDYERLMYAARFKHYLPEDKGIILKLNLSWTKFFPSCSSPPWQLDGVLTALKNNGYSEIYPVENKTVVTNPVLGAKLNKWLPVLKKHNLNFMPLTNVEWENFTLRKELLALDDIFPREFKIPKMFIGKSVIHTPSMKVHGHTQTTGAMKNAFGGLITARRHHCHKRIHEVLVDLLSIQKEIHPSIFAVMDGTVAGDGNGPRTMIPKVTNFILASNDQVAIDAISARMMGFDPMKIKYIKLAHDLGLGCGDVRQIDLVGDDITNVNLRFSTGKSPVILFDQIMRNHSHLIEKYLFHTKLFNLCIFGSEFYHDHVWYNLIGKQRINKFMKTGWGRLFRDY